MRIVINEYNVYHPVNNDKKKRVACVQPSKKWYDKRMQFVLPSTIWYDKQIQFVQNSKQFWPLQENQCCFCSNQFDYYLLLFNIYNYT